MITEQKYVQDSQTVLQSSEFATFLSTGNLSLLLGINTSSNLYQTPTVLSPHMLVNCSVEYIEDLT